MNQLNINHGTDCDVGDLMSRRPRDGTEGNARDGTDGNPRDGTGRRPRDETERRPRDGTERRPRDGTERRPRDGTERRPRDKTLLRESSLGIRNKNRITEYPKVVQTRKRPSSKIIKDWWGKSALWTGMGEVCPEVNGKYGIMNEYLV